MRPDGKAEKFAKKRTSLNIPDATIGLSVFSQDDSIPAEDTPELHVDNLWKLQKHWRKWLTVDPLENQIETVFLFAVYEAKAIAGDYAEARRQACIAAASYLDMLDSLARKPMTEGPPGPYQTNTCCCNHVVIFTSMGTHWNITVAHRRRLYGDKGTEQKRNGDAEYVREFLHIATASDTKNSLGLPENVERTYHTSPAGSGVTVPSRSNSFLGSYSVQALCTHPSKGLVYQNGRRSEEWKEEKALVKSKCKFTSLRVLTKLAYREPLPFELLKFEPFQFEPLFFMVLLRTLRSKVSFDHLVKILAAATTHGWIMGYVGW